MNEEGQPSKAVLNAFYAICFVVLLTVFVVVAAYV